MKKIILFIAIAIFLAGAFLISCDSSGGDSNGGSDATLLGDDLILSGTIDRTFDTSTFVLTESYTNPGNSVFRLYDENDDNIYDTDGNFDEEVDLSIIGAPAGEHLYDPAGGGITSSNASALVTSVVIDIEGTSDGIVYGNLAVSPALMYYYLYSTAKTTLDGSFTDESSTHVFDNVTFFAGWNRVIQSTTDGTVFTYMGGTITGGHWTHMNNLEE